jgi:hypothetical protein
MCSAARLLGRVTLSALLLLGAALAQPNSQASGARQDVPGAVAYRTEVRLRKLHLVRPDLIPYPIEYEIYC